MEQWSNKVAVITGASRGIGANLVEELLKSGLIVVGLARREMRMLTIKRNLSEIHQKNFHPIKCDIRMEQEVIESFKWIDENLGGTDILVNCAATANLMDMSALNNTSDIKSVLNTNLIGAFYCIREASFSIRRKSNIGHIVLMGSYGALKKFDINPDYPSVNMYTPSKAALFAMVQTFRQEFLQNGNHIKLTIISPGCVQSEIIGGLDDYPMLKSKDCTSAILFALGTPSHVEIHEIVIKPMGEKY